MSGRNRLHSDLCRLLLGLAGLPDINIYILSDIYIITAMIKNRARLNLFLLLALEIIMLCGGKSVSNTKSVLMPCDDDIKYNNCYH